MGWIGENITGGIRDSDDGFNRGNAQPKQQSSGRGRRGDQGPQPPAQEEDGQRTQRLRNSFILFFSGMGVAYGLVIADSRVNDGQYSYPPLNGIAGVPICHYPGVLDGLNNMRPLEVPEQ